FLDATRREVLDDLVGHLRADAVDRRQLLLVVAQLAEVGALIAHRPRGSLIRHHAKAILAQQLKHFACSLKPLRQGTIAAHPQSYGPGHGDRDRTHPASAMSRM